MNTPFGGVSRESIRNGVWSGDEPTISGMHPRSDASCLEWRVAEVFGPDAVIPMGPRRRGWIRLPVVTSSTLERRVRIFARAAGR